MVHAWQNTWFDSRFVSKLFPYKNLNWPMNKFSDKSKVSDWPYVRLLYFIGWEKLHIRIYLKIWGDFRIFLGENFRYFSFSEKKISNEPWLDFVVQFELFDHFFNRTHENPIRIRTKLKITHLATRFSNYSLHATVPG